MRNQADILDGLPEIKMAIAYELNGKRINHFVSQAEELALCKPIYETLPGWSEVTYGLTKAGSFASKCPRLFKPR